MYCNVYITNLDVQHEHIMRTHTIAVKYRICNIYYMGERNKSASGAKFIVERRGILRINYYYIHFRDDRNIDLVQQYTLHIVVPRTDEHEGGSWSVPCYAEGLVYIRSRRM